MEEKLTIPSEVTRPALYRNVYKGSFKDKNPDMRPAGILTYAPGENVQQSLKYFVGTAAVLPNVEKFHHYASPDISEIRVHYGHANDSKAYNNIVHGLRSGDKAITTKDCINPTPSNTCDALKNEMSELVYRSKKAAPLGRVPSLNLAKHIDPYNNIFGMKLNRELNARECINPNKDRPTVELETTAKHDQYLISHNDYEPGEQKIRKFNPPFNNQSCFGKRTEAAFDGSEIKRSMSWLPQTLLERRNQIDSKVLDDFKEKYSHQIGKTLDPKKETRYLGPDHAFGLPNNGEPYGAADVMLSRTQDKILKGKERQRAFIASLRSHICGFNHTKFKTLVEAFKFFDKNKDGFIDIDELKLACAATNFPLGSDLAGSLLEESDFDHDGKLNFLEFSNFLCFKDTMKLGIKVDPNSPEDEEFKDDEGRILLKKSDLMHKNNIAVNELVPRTLVTQLDLKVGNWKTTYDIINDAPFRAEPLKKRVYGVPSIRNDLIPPNLKKIQDKSNYGNDGNVWSLITPSLYSEAGVYERDVLKSRSKEEIKQILKNVGYDVPSDLFDHVFEQAQKKNPYGEVSVEEFKSILGRFSTKKLQSESKSELICS